MSNLAQKITENVAAVRERIAAAAARAGRDAAKVTLVAVTKYAGPEPTRAVFAAGCRALGESRPQQLWPKAEALRDLDVEWHMIGHLQRNKIRRTLPLLKMMQSVDNLRLLEAIDRTAGELSLKMPVLLEVKVAEDAEKHGFSPASLPALLGELARFAHVDIQGLMCMASLAGEADLVRRDFAALRNLRDELAKECPPNVDLRELSMGMSGDFEAAIEEGATIVRVGSALFEGVTL